MASKRDVQYQWEIVCVKGDTPIWEQVPSLPLPELVAQLEGEAEAEAKRLDQLEAEVRQQEREIKLLKRCLEKYDAAVNALVTARSSVEAIRKEGS